MKRHILQPKFSGPVESVLWYCNIYQDFNSTYLISTEPHKGHISHENVASLNKCKLHDSIFDDLMAF